MNARIAELLAKCGTPEAIMPPTELFNEGWLLRLTVDLANRAGPESHPFHLFQGARWCSELLLASRFLPRYRGDPLAEAHTHADAVLGHFSLRNGEAVIDPSAKQFEVIEAKLSSPLSSRTKNAVDYDQAARNVACMIHLVMDGKVNRAGLSKFSFTVVAPKSQIDSKVFGELVTEASVRSKVLSRVAGYEGSLADWHRDFFEPILGLLRIQLLSWEETIEAIAACDERELLKSFYKQCLRFNPVRQFQNAL